MVMKVHFLYWCINFTIFWCCKVTYYKKTMMKKGHILHWAMGVVMTPLLGSCAADDIGDAGATPALPEATRGFG